MEVWKVLAVDTDYKFKSRNDGNMVPGIRLLLTPPVNECGDRTRFRGFEWMEQFITNERMRELNVQPMPGDTIQLIFNRYGSIEEIKIV